MTWLIGRSPHGHSPRCARCSRTSKSVPRPGGRKAAARALQGGLVPSGARPRRLRSTPASCDGEPARAVYRFAQEQATGTLSLMPARRRRGAGDDRLLARPADGRAFRPSRRSHGVYQLFERPFPGEFASRPRSRRGEAKAAVLGELGALVPRASARPGSPRAARSCRGRAARGDGRRARHGRGRGRVTTSWSRSGRRPARATDAAPALEG